METTAAVPSGFVARRLPWVIAAGAWVLFLLTLNTSLPFRGVGPLAVASGLEWRPQFVAPVHYLVTYPVRWLPAGAQSVVMSILAAVWAAGALGLLARSVALLPHDRTRDQRSLERHPRGLLSVRSAWLPPVLAVLACGLQLTFWENAVVGTGEAFDLLLLAYVIRAVLEFRLARKDSWLYRAAFVYALGMTNNYAMIPLLPAFVLAVGWMRGRAFFQLAFLSKMLLAGLAGLAFYLVLPLVNHLAGYPEAGFWPSLTTQLGLQKQALLQFPRFVIVLVALTSLIPVLFIGIRWPASFGDVSAAGNTLTNLMMHMIHGVFLVFCLAVTFDLPFSPRRLAVFWAMLPIYYLGALSIGYFAGYFLLVFNPAAPLKPWQRPSALRSAFNGAVVGLVWLAAVAVPAGLAYKNLPLIRLDKKAGMKPLAEAMVASLPPAGAVVLADDQPLLNAVALVLRQRHQADNFVLVHSQSLVHRVYHRELSRRYPGRWPVLPGESSGSLPVDIETQLQMFGEVRKILPLVYLQPTFGSYLEQYYLKPSGLVYQMVPFPPGQVLPPRLTPAEIAAAEQAWAPFLADQLVACERGTKGRQPYPPVAAVAALSSRMLNQLGVEIQRTGDYAKAGQYFALALRANAENPVAFINAEYNRQIQAGKFDSIALTDAVRQRFAAYAGNLGRLLGANGSPDEPSLALFASEYFARSRNFRQAAWYIARAMAFLPESLEPRLNYASALIQLREADQALALIAETRRLAALQGADLAVQLAFDQTEAWAYFAKGDLARAEQLLRAAQTKYPSLAGPYSTLVDIYIASGRSTNAMAVIQEQLRVQPRDVNALINYGVLLVQQGLITNAVTYFDRALLVEPGNHVALMNRAICNLNAGLLDEAERDYVTLQRNLPR
ncbi:MAG TPA: tetratricopeptide repeat protein, partial [Methylomirabilota bacterium]|nr:tetratricopeptide repeat protein [Methylomirabilota bacterium]